MLRACAFFFLLVSSEARRDLFLKKDVFRSSLAEQNRTSSLANLLRHLIDAYFDHCTLKVVYDSNYEIIHPVDFHRYFGGLKLSVVQDSVDISRGVGTKNDRSDKCTNYVIFLYNIYAVTHILSQENEAKIVIVSSESPWEVKDFLRNHASRIYKNLLVIAHSTSRKNGYGSYLLYTHKLYAEGSGTTLPILLGSWINNGMTVKGRDLFPEKLGTGFMGHRILVSAVHNPPFTISRNSPGAEDSLWDGLEVNLLRMMANYLNLTMEISSPRSSGGLSPLESAKQDLLLGLTSSAVGGIYQTAQLHEQFDTSMPFLDDCASFISLASTALPKYRAMLGPFQLTVWLMLCASYLALIVPLSFNSKYTRRQLLRQPSAVNGIFWYIFSTYTNSFSVENPLLDYGIAKNSTTLLLAIYWLFTIIVTACYTGSIVAFITLPIYPEAIETAAELQTYRYRIGTLDHDGWDQWFGAESGHDEPFLERLFRKIEYVPSLMEGVRNASRAYFWPYAFLGSRAALDYLVQTEFALARQSKRSLMHISQECFVRYNVVQLFPRKSLYTRYVDGFVLRAQQSGLVDRMRNQVDWQVQRAAINDNKQIIKKMSRKIVVEDRVLMVEDTQGMFMVLLAGVLAGLLSLGIEAITVRLKKRGRVQAVATPSPEPSSLADSCLAHDEYYARLRSRFSRSSI
ncbi:hypothetical protein TKK_0005486 [Trichogramma kaykai]|uniref:Ionotropic glutamate receptor C-terminal domain-containing protein n=1 Tax=Trichogramma kaykai TaxID=54128 RepID=A0ABD2XI75_9HYME